jgi:hypothetical protein
VDAYHFYQPHTKYYPTFYQGYCHVQRKLMAFCALGHNRLTADHISYICQILEKKQEYNETVRQLFIDFKRAYGLVRREVLYNIHIEFGNPSKSVRLIKICPNEIYSKALVGKHLSDMFPVKNGLKQGDVL